MNTQIYEEATDWLVEFRTGDVEHEARRRFDAWLRQSPDHLRAYLEMTEIWQDAGDVKREARSVNELIARARTHDNVTRLDDTGIANDLRQPKDERARRFNSRPAFAVAASICLLVAGAWLFVHHDVYATGLAEQRSIRLDDGSLVQLNARSRIRVRFTAEARGIELLEGQALFRVAKEQGRPFVVAVDAAQVKAVGTQFDVYRRQGGTVVTVVEGRVLVTSSQRQKPLAAGEQLVLRPTAALEPARVDAASVTAWTQHRLVFKSSSLPEVVEEFNRYNERPLRIEGPELAGFRISGVYTSTDPALLLQFLREQPGVGVRASDREIVLYKRD